MNYLKLPALAALTLLALAPCACTDEETDIARSLTDPTMLYDGQTHVFSPDVAYSRRDDSLVTSGLSYGIVGNYSDATFGSVSSVIYTQIALPQTRSSVDISGMEVDSVVLSIVKDALYPDTAAGYDFHFEVRQLASPLYTDTTYYASSELPVAAGAPLYDGTVHVGNSDTIINLTLDPSLVASISKAASAAELVESGKGLRISLLPSGDQGMLSVNFAATKTRLRVHYHLGTDSSYVDYAIGVGANHFTHFEHDYSGTLFASADSVDGSQLLYLEPMGGHDIYLNFDSCVRAFATAHPTAVIHQALLVLPVANVAQPMLPDLIVALHKENGKDYYVDDFSSSGYGGTYDEATNSYRLRLSQHLQGLLRDGGDHGLRLILNGRASTAHRVVIEGTQSSNPIRLEFEYTE